jgi:accessory colonization factor AcfC
LKNQQKGGLMSGKIWFFFGLLLLQASVAVSSSIDSDKTLRVYGPGGPHEVIEKCAKLFKARHGVNVDVVKAFPHNLERRLREDGDLYYGGAEYMLEGFDRKNPGVLDMSSAQLLHPRRIGIIVRKGNPLQIDGVEDLTLNEVRILDVKLENMRHFHGADSGLSYNIRRFEYTGKQGADAWLDDLELDAWVTYKTWHFTLQNESEFVEIPGDAGLRYTPVAVTQHSQMRQEASRFISFLKSEEARTLFEQHGWY